MVQVEGADRFAETDPDRTYAIEGVKPGTCDVGFRHDLIDDGYLAENVTVTEGGEAVADASLTDDNAPVWDGQPGVVYVYNLADGNGQATVQERENLLTAVGNVGIGTKNPQGLLHVEASDGSAFVVDDLTGNVGIGTTAPHAALTVGSVDGQQTQPGNTTGTFAVDSTGNVISGAWQGDPIDLAHGGTGATDMTTARSNLGLGCLAVMDSVSGGASGLVDDGTVTDDDIADSAAIDFSKLDIQKTDITGLGIPAADTDTTYTAALGITLEGTAFSLDPQGADAGQVLKWDGTGWGPSEDLDTDTDTTLTESEVDAFAANNGYLTSYTETDPTVDLSKLQTLVTNDFHNLGGADLDTTLSDGDIAAMGYIKTAGETDPTVDLSKLQTLVTNDFHNLGGTDADTTYTAAAGVTLEGTTFSLDQQGAAGGEVLKWNGTAWAPAADIDTDTDTTYTAGANITFTGTTIDAAADGHSLDSSDGAITDAVIVTPDGSVGIGIASPLSTLEVAGGIAVFANGATFEVEDRAIVVTDASAPTMEYEGLFVQSAVSAPSDGVNTMGVASRVTATGVPLEGALSGSDINAVLAEGTADGGASVQGIYAKAFYNGTNTDTTFTSMPLASGVFGRAYTGTAAGDDPNIAVNAVGVGASADTVQLGSNTGVSAMARGAAHRNIGTVTMANLSDAEAVTAYSAIPAGFSAALYANNNGAAGDDYVIYATGGKSFYEGDVIVGSTVEATRFSGIDAALTGAITVGTTSGTAAGTIRYNGGGFEGYDGSSWKALDVQPTGSAGGWTQGTGVVSLTTSGDNVGIGTTMPGAYKLNVAGAAYFGATVEVASGVKIDTRDLSADGLKLDAMETGADVTDATNVAAADTYATAPLSSYGRTLVDDADAATARATLGLGTIATQEANAVALTGGAIDGTTIGLTTPANGSFNGLAVATGLGIGTTAPEYQLHIKGSGYPWMTIESTDTSGGGLGLISSSEEWQIYVEGSDLDVWQGDDATGASRLFIASGGSVGIGTTSPDEILHIHRNQDGYTRLKIENTDTGPFAFGLLQFYNGTAAGDAESGYIGLAGPGYTGVASWQDSVIVRSASGVSGGIKLAASTGGIKLSASATEGNDLCVNASGNVGVGTTAPNEKLTLEGALSLDEVPSPAATAGYGKFYVKSTDSLPYFLDGAGNEYPLAPPPTRSAWTTAAFTSPTPAPTAPSPSRPKTPTGW